MKIKEILLKKAEKNPEKYFPVRSLKELGYQRKKCRICGRYFWTKKEEKEVCNDHEGYTFINSDLKFKKINYQEVWKDFERFMNKKGYLTLDRYPVLARWRDDIDFVIASIVVFQPYVVSGEVEPPSQKVIIPQFCLRFTDIENVGRTSRHYTGFDMIGQHVFVKPANYDIDSYFQDLFEWFKSLKIPDTEVVFHEDAWVGGGNAGTSLEFFVRGLEVANQVYMQFEVRDSNVRELKKIKVLDMGMGHERVSWLLNKTITSYDSIFPSVLSYLKRNTFLELNEENYKKIAPYLNFLEENYLEGVRKISKTVNMNENIIRELIENFKILYSVAEHTRTLLISISDGALPSNIGGGYNLRFIFRRAYNFFEKNFSGDFLKLFELHLKDLKGFYDISKEDFNVVIEVIKNEISKYKETSRKIERIKEMYKRKKPTTKELFELYISYGVRPSDIGYSENEEFKKMLDKFKEKSKKLERKQEKILEGNYPETRKVYYEDWKRKILLTKCIGSEKDYFVFDSTIFYPVGGGQDCDKGWIVDLEFLKKEVSGNVSKEDFIKFFKEVFGYYDEEIEKYLSFSNKTSIDLEKFKDKIVEVEEVIKDKNVVLHKLSREIKIGRKYLMILDWKRRLKLSMYHDAIHILNGILRKKFGKIIWQYGAEKKENYGRLDVTYYRIPTMNEILEIEEEVNRIIWEDRKIIKKWIPRIEAERKYGISIYQGGAVPGKILRIVEIEGVDVEACGGTHGDSTGYIGMFLIKNVEKISDSVIRFEVLVHEDALKYVFNKILKIKNIAKILRSNEEIVDKSVIKIFEEMKKYKKEKEKYLKEIINILRDSKTKEIKLSDNLDLEDLIIITNNLSKYKEKVVVYNGRNIVGFNVDEKKIEKMGYKIIKRGKFIIGEKI